MNLNLDNKVAVVAGSSRGIGRAIAESLLQHGALVVLTGRNDESLQKTCDDLRAIRASAPPLAICGDFSDPAVIHMGLQRAVAHFGRIDHVIANLGTGSGQAGLTPDDADWQRLFQLNFFGSVRLAQASLSHLLTNEDGGSILFISSIVALEASSAPLAYSAAKAALQNYSKNLARKLGDKNIRVNTIAPGNILFPGGSWERKVEANGAAVNAMLRNEVPLQRFGTPADVASLAVYLCSEQAAFCTGGSYVVDGGQTRTL